MIGKVIFEVWELNNKHVLGGGSIEKLTLSKSCMLQRYSVQDKVMLL